MEFGLLLRFRKVIIQEPLLGLIHSLSSRAVKLVERESRNGDCQGWGEGSGKLLFNGLRVSVWQDEKVLEIGHTT